MEKITENFKLKYIITCLYSVFVICINAMDLQPGTYSKYRLDQPKLPMSHPFAVHYINIFDDGTFEWRRLGMVEYPEEENNIGTYRIDGDTLILNSVKKRYVSIDIIRDKSHLSNRRIFVESPSGRAHPFYVTCIDSNNDTVSIFANGCIEVPQNNRIIEIEDAYGQPIKIDGSHFKKKCKDIKITVSEERTFDNEKWIIKGDSIYYRTRNGYIYPTPLVLDGRVSNSTITLMTPSGYISDNGRIIIIGKHNNIELLELTKKHNFNTKGLILEILCYSKNNISARGKILVDTYSMMELAEINPIMIGTWTFYDSDKSFIKSEIMPSDGISFIPDEFLLKLSNMDIILSSGQNDTEPIPQNVK